MRLILTSILLLLTCGLSAQLNPRHIYVQEKQDVANSVEIQSLTFPPGITNNGFPDSGRDTLNIVPKPGVPNTYILTFDPPADFTGDTKIKIEYFESGPIPGVPYPNYTTIHYRIKPSKIITSEDYILASSGFATIDPLANDSGTDGPLSLAGIAYSSGGTATITGGNTQLEFQLDAGVSRGQVIYLVEDSLGTVAAASVDILEEDAGAIYTEERFADNKSVETLMLPSGSFTLDVSPSNGNISAGPEDHIFYYQADENFTGMDYCSFSSGSGGVVEFDITVVNKSVSSSFVIDDEVHSVVDGSVSFNVFDNDLRSDLNIVDYSSELTYNGNGSFTYTPPTGFSGDQVFFYKVFSGVAFHTGNIYVHVDDYGPMQDIDYSFDILKGQSLRIVHETPVTAFEFSELVPPANGTVEVLDANGEFANECDTLNGINTIIYTPDPGFSGFDEFDLEYCTSSGHCEVIKIDVDVLDSNFDECLCLQNCVYKGDNNDDGIVNGKDILDIGLNIGNGGPDRTGDFNLIWTGQYAADWGYHQMNSDIDLKCGDSDGDGFITQSDFSDVTDHYGKLHRTVADPVTTVSDVPITFIPQQTEVDSGEWLTIDISVGSFAYPAVDMHGTAFSFNINPDLIDSSSVQFSLYDNTWINDDGAPVHTMVIVPEDGRVDIAVSRVAGAVDGLGIIGKLEFIVEDEIQGFKDVEGLYASVGLAMKDIISVNAYGEYTRHPDQYKTINLRREREEIISQEDLLQTTSIYPNPASEILNIRSAKYAVDHVAVFDVMGREIEQFHTDAFPEVDIDLTRYAQGMYIVRITSGQTSITHKFNKISY